ncbi:hypothetical protein SSTU70S_02814 [Stutzerimonas stutzeri]
MTPDLIIDQALTELTAALQQLRGTLRQPGAVIRGVLFDPVDGSAVEQESEVEVGLVHALSAWEIASESENGSVVRFPGVYEVRADVLSLVAALNEKKLAFAECVKALEQSGLKPHQMRSLYARKGFGRLHPLQAWRQVNVLDAQGLASIGFTVAKCTEGIEVLTYAQSLERLASANASDVIAQLESIAPPEHIHWHVPVSRHIRANVVWSVGGNRHSAMFHASLPFLVAEGGWPSKRIRFNEPRSHAKRRDVKGQTMIHLPYRKGSYLTMT